MKFRQKLVAALILAPVALVLYLVDTWRGRKNRKYWKNWAKDGRGQEATRIPPRKSGSAMRMP